MKEVEACQTMVETNLELVKVETGQLSQEVKDLKEELSLEKRALNAIRQEIADFEV